MDHLIELPLRGGPLPRGMASATPPAPIFDECTSIDLPGVGHVHGEGCRHAGSLVLRGWPYVAGEVVEPLRKFVAGEEPIEELWATSRHAAAAALRRDRLLAELVFAAGDVARWNLVETPGPRGIARWIWCRECMGGAEFGGPAMHRNTCRTGRVLRVLDDLVDTLDNPLGKETAEGGERDRAGDGIRARGFENHRDLEDQGDGYFGGGR